MQAVVFCWWETRTTTILIIFSLNTRIQTLSLPKGKGKGKVTLFNVGSPFSCETGINGSRRCALLTPLPLSVLRFTGIQNYDYTDQRKAKQTLG